MNTYIKNVNCISYTMELLSMCSYNSFRYRIHTFIHTHAQFRTKY